MKKAISLAAGLIFLPYSAFADQGLFYHFDFGTWFGGEKLAQNPGGDDYKAGSGALLGLGVEWEFNQQYQLLFRNNIGYRYQGAQVGRGGNRGIVFETALVKQIESFNLVAGLHLDMNAVTKDAMGNRIEYDNALGQYIGIEYLHFGTWGFGLKYLFQEYQLSNSEKASGDQFGLFLTGRF